LTCESQERCSPVSSKDAFPFFKLFLPVGSRRFWTLDARSGSSVLLQPPKNAAMGLHAPMSPKFFNLLLRFFFCRCVETRTGQASSTRVFFGGFFCPSLPLAYSSPLPWFLSPFAILLRSAVRWFPARVRLQPPLWSGFPLESRKSRSLPNLPRSFYTLAVTSLPR